MAATLKSFQGHIKDYKLQHGRYARCSAKRGDKKTCQAHLTKAGKAKKRAEAVAQKLLSKAKVPKSIIQAGLKQLAATTGAGTPLHRPTGAGAGTPEAAPGVPEFQVSTDADLEEGGGGMGLVLPVVGLAALAGGAWWFFGR